MTPSYYDKSMTYDQNGNLTSVTNACGTTTYTWDARNRLIAINGFTSALTSRSTCEDLTASFKYDALGRRIEKTINGRRVQYLYDGLDMVQEVESGAVTVNFLRTLSIDEPLARVESSGAVRYYQQDALGSVIAMSDESGAVKTQYLYDPFGNVTISGEASDNLFQYTGRENDGTGLYYYRARYYSPELQRFISEDPIRLDSGDVNFYVYVGNNPTNFFDPEGLQGSPLGEVRPKWRARRGGPNAPIGGKVDGRNRTGGIFCTCVWDRVGFEKVDSDPCGKIIRKELVSSISDPNKNMETTQGVWTQGGCLCADPNGELQLR